MESVRNYFNPKKNDQWKESIKYSYKWDITKSNQQPNLFIHFISSPPSYFPNTTESNIWYSSLQQTYFKIYHNIILVFSHN